MRSRAELWDGDVEPLSQKSRHVGVELVIAAVSGLGPRHRLVRAVLVFDGGVWLASGVLRRPVAIRQVAGSLLWAAAVSVVILLLVYPTVPSGWPSLVVQVAAYGLIVIPVLLVRPRPPLPLGATSVTVSVGLAVLLASVITAAVVSKESPSAGAAAAVRAVSAGVGEELVFRGLIFERLRAVVDVVVLQVLLNGLLFTAFHIPLVLVQGTALTQLAVVFVFGAVFSALRVVSRGLLLPTALHVAVDLVG